VGYHAGALLTALRCTRVNVKKYGSTLLSLAYAVISGYLVVAVSPTPLISRYAPWLLFLQSWTIRFTYGRILCLSGAVASSRRMLRYK